MTLRPLYDRIHLGNSDAAAQTAFGINVRDTAKSAQREVEIGSAGTRAKAKNAMLISLDVKAADGILVGN
ncbi:co-chaperonin GroES (HSP10) [Novosphingobium sp. 1529]|uniref:co-chaperone GroES n=1 Tax=Novosphingobium sp. 1529 TaxID=3156424 RepID=UPI001494B4DA